MGAIILPFARPSAPQPKAPAALTPSESHLRSETQIDERHPFDEFLDPCQWETSARGNPWRTFEGVSVVIFHQGRGWRWGVFGPNSARRWSEHTFKDVDSAKWDAYSTVTWMADCGVG
jgi:hypothetical protein